jgi:hypothetical protein
MIENQHRSAPEPPRDGNALFVERPGDRGRGTAECEDDRGRAVVEEPRQRRRQPLLAVSVLKRTRIVPDRRSIIRRITLGSATQSESGRTGRKPRPSPSIFRPCGRAQQPLADEESNLDPNGIQRTASLDLINLTASLRTESISATAETFMIFLTLYAAILEIMAYVSFVRLQWLENDQAIKTPVVVLFDAQVEP